MNKQVRWLGLAAAFGVHACALAAPEERMTPPPGMYKIEVKSDQYTLAGMGPGSMCVKPMHSIVIPNDMLANNCTLTKGQVVSGQVMMQLSCPWNRVVTKTRKVNADVWETTVDTVTQRGPDRTDIGASMAQIKYMAQQIASQGNDEERAEAREFLANEHRLESRMKNNVKPPLSPKVIELMAANAGTRTVVVQRMTRTGDCKG